jgi:GAF domain-containing protein
VSRKPDQDQNDIERQREQSLTAYGLRFSSDGPHHDEDFTRVAERARAVTGADAAYVNILVDDRQLMFGSAGGPATVTARHDSICDTAMWQADEDGIVAIPDTRRDAAFAENPWVNGALGEFRFYAAAPLIGREGLPLGTICCMAGFPRQITPSERSALRRLADLTVQILEVRRHVREVGGH